MNVFDVLRDKLERNSYPQSPLYDMPIQIVGLVTAIDIVNHVEQEYNNDFCEWKFEETTGIVWHCDDKCTTYNLSYAANLRIIADDFECKCPYCGKKIKVIEC